MSISADDFYKTCESLQTAWQQTSQGSEWEDVKILESYWTKYLRITKHIQLTNAEPEPGKEAVSQTQDDDEHEFDDEDDEALVTSTSANHSRQCQVNYDVVHSATYQVPVLYLTIEHTGQDRLNTPDSVYELLVPASHRPQMQAVGVMGAVSMTDHPVTGLPCWFVHPCRTAEAMGAMTGPGGARVVDRRKYLLMWMGLVGGGVGLNVPIKVVEVMSQPGRLPVRGLETC